MARARAKRKASLELKETTKLAKNVTVDFQWIVFVICLVRWLLREVGVVHDESEGRAWLFDIVSVASFFSVQFSTLAWSWVLEVILVSVVRLWRVAVLAM